MNENKNTKNQTAHMMTEWVSSYNYCCYANITTTLSYCLIGLFYGVIPS